MKTRRSGDEAVAHWRIQPAVWAGRLLGAYLAVTAVIMLVVRRNIGVGLVELGIAAGVCAAAEMTRKGSRVAAVALVVAFVLLKIAMWLLTGVPVASGWLLWIPAVWSFGSGVWGTFALAAVRRRQSALADHGA